MRKIHIALVFLCGFIIAPCAMSDPMLEAISGMCRQVKQCTVQHVAAKKNITDDAKKMLNNAFDQQCDSMKARYQRYVGDDAALLAKALACVNDLSKATCDDLLKNNKPKSCIEMQ